MQDSKETSSSKPARYTRVQFFVDSFFVVLFIAVWGILLYKFIFASIHFSLLSHVFLIVPFSFILSILIADLLSGVMHFLGDSVGDENTFYFGKVWILPFRYHHIVPSDIVSHNFSELNGNAAFICLPVLVIACLFFSNQESGLKLFFHGFILFTTLALFLTNSIHRWAHMVNPPRVVSFLQRSYLILHPKKHAIHHTYPHTSYYSITTGWSNVVLNKIIFFFRNRK